MFYSKFQPQTAAAIQAEKNAVAVEKFDNPVGVRVNRHVGRQFQFGAFRHSEQISYQHLLRSEPVHFRLLR